MKFYAVQKGRLPGVYSTWESCQKQVKGFPGAKYKSFKTRQEAEAFAFGVGNQEEVPETPPETSSPSPRVQIWVDGSCLHNGEGPMYFGWAFLIVAGHRELHRASGNIIPEDAQQHRNVAGEIQAVLEALAWCQQQGIPTATIHYDYQGLASWVDGSWKAKTSFTQAYVDAVRSSGMSLGWEKVQAHSGEHYNEIVDQLARDAARSAT